MKRGWLIFALVATLPGAVVAAVPAPGSASAPKPAAAPPLALTPGVRRITLSPEGNAIATKIMGTPDPRLAQIQVEITAVKQEELKLIAGPTVDVDKLEPLFRREETLLTETRARKNDRMITLLRALSDPDRVALLQTLANPPKPQNSKPAAAPAH